MTSTETLDTTRRRVTASLIGGTGGAAYVLINSSDLGEPAAAVLRTVAILSLVWIYVWLGLLVSASAVVAGILVATGAGPAPVTVFDAIVPGVTLLAFGALSVPSAPPRASVAPAAYAAAGTATRSSGHHP